MSEELFTVSLGAIPSPVDVRDYKLKDVALAQSFPESFELKMRGVKNQGSVGSCVAHSLAEIIEYHDFLQNGGTADMSVGFIYGNRRNSGYKSYGMVVRDALDAVVTCGDVTKSEFNVNVEVPEAITKFEASFDKLKSSAYPNRFSKYFRVKTENEIKTALMNYGPVCFAITWYNDMKVENGILKSKCDPNNASGGHCMVIYGWDARGWKIMNSWGIGWGKSGCAILPYDFKLNEAWGITDNIKKDDLKTPFDSKVGAFVAKVVNAIVNFFKRR